MRAVENALHQRQQGEHANIDVAEVRQQHEDEHVDDAERVDQHRCRAAVESIREDPEHRAEQDGRRELREGDDADPELRLRELPGEPPQCDPVDPEPQQRNRAAGEVGQELACFEG